MSEEKKQQKSVRRSVHIDCPIDETFQLFTEHIGEWWPLRFHSVSGNETQSCVIEPWQGGRVFERTRSGEEYEWGEVTTWDPPRCLELRWDVGGLNETIQVNFTVDARGTEVTVTHAGHAFSGETVCTAVAGCFLAFMDEKVFAAF